MLGDLSNFDIDRIARRDPVLSSVPAYAAACTKDSLQGHLHANGWCVLLLRSARVDGSSGSGTDAPSHWTLLWAVDRRFVYYSDSMGFTPPRDVLLWVEQNGGGRRFIVNDVQLQLFDTSSRTCGDFALLTARMLAQGTHPHAMTRLWWWCGVTDDQWAQRMNEAAVAEEVKRLGWTQQ